MGWDEMWEKREWIGMEWNKIRGRWEGGEKESGFWKQLMKEIEYEELRKNEGSKDRAGQVIYIVVMAGTKEWRWK
jgi:hypothetical protein